MGRSVADSDRFTILLTLIVALFIIGLLIMIFALMGGGLSNATLEEGLGNINESILLTVGCEDTSVSGLSNIQLTGYVVRDESDNIINESEYTIAGGQVCLN